MLQIFEIIVLVFSAIIHEYMHGFVADKLGDPTARQMGRLTLNPLPHIDLFGSIIVPLLMILGNFGFVFGWAKPVPVNPYNLRDQKYGWAKVAIAGPAGNLVLALMFGIFLRFFSAFNANLTSFLIVIVWVNLILMIFNLVPIPPLDGSRVLAAFLPAKVQAAYFSLEKYGLFLVLLFMMFGYNFIYPVVYFLFRLITGLN